ncbi:MAG: heavy-metal-associated domain-containing protein [Candidatus Asgardarchaeia archaeon]
MSKEEKRLVSLKIGGMHCANCALTIEKNLRSLHGVEKAEVSFASEKATVVFDPKIVDLKKIKETIENTGYYVVYEKVTIQVSGLRDQIDANKLEETLRKVEGIRNVSVNYVNGQVFLEYNPALFSLSDIKKIITDYGLDVIHEEFALSVEEIEAKKIETVGFPRLSFIRSNTSLRLSRCVLLSSTGWNTVSGLYHIRFNGDSSVWCRLEILSRGF